MKDDFFCRRWNIWVGGATGCFQVVVNRSMIYWLDHNSQVVREEEYVAPE
ncbi:MAG: hypothetical protein GDA49_07075 [Rhodospirillales bacterium]|nr:hypothetical protein [Rhodospirillales bacterium]